MTRMRRVSRVLDSPPGARIGAALLVGVLLGWLLSWNSVVAAVLGGWAGAGLVFVTWTALVIVPMDPEETSEHAVREEPTRGVANVIVLLAALASLAAVAVTLVGGVLGNGDVTMAAVLAAVIVSWACVHTVFALHYARAYYTTPAGGIDFHQTEPPRYTDFTYLAITVGMSFAVSDTDLRSSGMRRVAQVHALLAYLFGTVVVALLINLVAGLANT
ncbi:DUF1345 domain-containing protein [Promicromonospora panici]|uniref:DUF1345 domain-containing protein n=1 Tax=Promicromonospora panici TaxID=2219658 RepID=UPI001F5D14DA|nr:DUF1345 domain-containing protein [Promicromonospora panici]